MRAENHLKISATATLNPGNTINLSVALPQLSKDMGFAGPSFAVTSSWALTIFLIGYALANILGGIVTRGLDPKPVVIWSFAIWSAVTVAVG